MNAGGKGLTVPAIIASSDPVQRAVAGPYEPDFSVWVLSAETPYSSDGAYALDIDGDDLAVVFRLYSSAHLSLVDLITVPGGIFGRVAMPLWRHASSPMSKRNETRLPSFYPFSQSRALNSSTVKPACRIIALNVPLATSL